MYIVPLNHSKCIPISVSRCLYLCICMIILQKSIHAYKIDKASEMEIYSKIHPSITLDWKFIFSLINMILIVKYTLGTSYVQTYLCSIVLKYIWITIHQIASGVWNSSIWLLRKIFFKLLNEFIAKCTFSAHCRFSDIKPYF